jgi:predicted acyl esterase
MGGALINVDVIFERDLAVPMRDGVILSANLFRPADGKRAPVVMSVTPYGNDQQRDRLLHARDRRAIWQRHLINRGRHVIHCGGRFDSHLLMPLIRGAIRPSAGSS